MINNIFKISLSGLIGIFIGIMLVLFVEPETTNGAIVLVVIVLIPSLILGKLITKFGRPKKTSESKDSPSNK